MPGPGALASLWPIALRLDLGVFRMVFLVLGRAEVALGVGELATSMGEVVSPWVCGTAGG